MAYSQPVTRATGDLISASNWNNDIRANMIAIWAGTTAGDIDYYTSATAKSRVAIGTSGYILKSTGTAPAWENPLLMPGALNAKGVIDFSPVQTINGTSLADITGSGLSLVTTATCTIFVRCYCVVKPTNGLYAATMRIAIDGTYDTADATFADNVINDASNDARLIYAMEYYRTGVAAGTRVCKVGFLNNSASGSVVVTSGRLIAQAFTE